jgi:hypothetical protein
MADKPNPQEYQATQERENAERLGNDESAKAAEKRLAASAASRAETAARSRKQAIGDGDTKTDRAPQGRRAPARQQS